MSETEVKTVASPIQCETNQSAGFTVINPDSIACAKEHPELYTGSHCLKCGQNWIINEKCPLTAAVESQISVEEEVKALSELKEENDGYALALNQVMERLKASDNREQCPESTGKPTTERKSCLKRTIGHQRCSNKRVTGKPKNQTQ
jgi:hypothetical protein